MVDEDLFHELKFDIDKHSARRLMPEYCQMDEVISISLFEGVLLLDNTEMLLQQCVHRL